MWSQSCSVQLSASLQIHREINLDKCLYKEKYLQTKAVTPRNWIPLKHKFQVVAVKYKDVFQDLKACEWPALLISVKSTVGSLRHILGSSVYGTTPDTRTWKANTSHKVLDNMQMHMALAMYFCESAFMEAFCGLRSLRTFWHTNHNSSLWWPTSLGCYCWSRVWILCITI